MAYVINRTKTPQTQLFSFVAVNLLYVPLEPHRGHRMTSVYLCIFDRLIKKKTDYAWLPQRVAPKTCSQLSCGTLHFDMIWHISFGMFLPSDPKKKPLAAWWAAAAGTTKATAISMSRFSGAYCRGFASVVFFAMSCSCGHLVNSRILANPDLPTTRFNVVVSLTPFFVYPQWFHCVSLPSKQQRQHLWWHQECRKNNTGLEGVPNTPSLQV